VVQTECVTDQQVMELARDSIPPHHKEETSWCRSFYHPKRRLGSEKPRMPARIERRSSKPCPRDRSPDVTPTFKDSD
jgi:hypothetical protein